VAPWVLWLIAAGLFAAGEVVSVDLVLLMFTAGALGGAGVAVLGGPVALQLLAFVAVSLALLTVVRPIAKRHLTATSPGTAIGAAAVIGRTATVTRPVDRQGGRIKLGADEWTARSQHSAETFAVGEVVRILEIEGATAVVGESLE
jgi:membrane protein implicated in regulation of membrane protease activity